MMINITSSMSTTVLYRKHTERDNLCLLPYPSKLEDCLEILRERHPINRKYAQQDQLTVKWSGGGTEKVDELRKILLLQKIVYALYRMVRESLIEIDYYCSCRDGEERKDVPLSVCRWKMAEAYAAFKKDRERGCTRGKGEGASIEEVYIVVRNGMMASKGEEGKKNMSYFLRSYIRTMKMEAEDYFYLAIEDKKMELMGEVWALEGRVEVMPPGKDTAVMKARLERLREEKVAMCEKAKRDLLEAMNSRLANIELMKPIILGHAGSSTEWERKA